METDVLSKLSKEQLEELVRTYARNMLALDGVWFQSVERELGMDRAMRHDERVWQAFTKRRHGASKDSCSCPTGRDWTDWSGRFRSASRHSPTGRSN